ncbi:MAG: polysaccharide biosynthesis/export family protein [Desulfobacterales bacterium]|nr:polysaccharide biosynthesis/export family protein [Desulfobacterales bacterium]
MMNKSSKTVVLYVLVLIFSGIWPPAHAQNPENPGYRLGVNDVIKVTITASGVQEAEAELVVSSRGTVNIPLIGSVQAAGLTVPELEKKIYTPLERDYFVDPQVHIQISEYHSLSYFIAGAVKEPGLYELNFVPSVLDLIVKAGGVEEGRGNIAYILKNNRMAGFSDKAIETEISKKAPVTIDLVKLLDQGDTSENIKLSSGDTVYIPLGTALNQTISKVYVQGQVKSPGRFDYQPGMTVLSACILAGGFEKYAAPGRTRIIRKGKETSETIKVDLDKIIKGDAPDVPLKPGDRVHVPESWF